MYSETALDDENFGKELNLRNWSHCPLEIMILFFSHLDLRSLATCMFVSKFWLEAAKYYLQHFNLWHKMVESTISNKGVLYKEKCSLQWRDILFNFFLWRKVGRARISHYQSFHIKNIKTMKVYRNNLIVALDDQVKYLNLLNGQCSKTLDVECITYEESDYLMTTLLQSKNKSDNRSLCIQNKNYGPDKQNCDIFNLNIFGCYKLYSKSCYFVDNSNTLWAAVTEEPNYFSVKALAKFYGPSCIVALHVFEHKVYIVTREGNMYYVDGFQFRKAHNIYLSFPCRTNTEDITSSTPMLFLFNKGCSAYRVPIEEAAQISKSSQLDAVTMAVPGLTALLEHGEVLILGYEDGKIEIHSIYKILRCLNEPEKQLNVRDFVYDQDGDYRIRGLDVYEQTNRHYLVVATENNVGENRETCPVPIPTMPFQYKPAENCQKRKKIYKGGVGKCPRRD